MRDDIDLHVYSLLIFPLEHRLYSGIFGYSHPFAIVVAWISHVKLEAIDLIPPNKQVGYAKETKSPKVGVSSHHITKELNQQFQRPW